MLEKLLTSGKQKQIVGVSLTPGLGLEAVLYDKKSQTVIKYGRKKVDYNLSTRDFQDYTQFKSALAELIDEMEVAPKTMAFMVLPNVYFDFIELPPEITTPEIKTALLSKAEEFYLFKREEPVSGWCNVINPDGLGQKKYAFTSFQKNIVEQLKDIFNEIQMQLVGVETSYSATLRGLFISGLINDMIEQQASWTLMQINTNSYTIFQMDGKNLIECSEIPLAIKSFSNDEAYQAIISSSSQLLNNYTIQRLYIVSQTDDISAKILKDRLDFDREVVTIDSNKFSKNIERFVELDESVDPDKARSMSLSVLGAADVRNDFNLVINALADDPAASMGIYGTVNILGSEYDVTNEFVVRVCLILSALLAIIFALLFAGNKFLDMSLKNVLDKTTTKVQELDRQIELESQNELKQEVDMNLIIDDIAGLNVTANRYYDSIATDIPKNVWLIRYYNTQGNKLAISGIAQTIPDIYHYYENLRIVAPESNIKLTELKVVTPNPDDLFIGDLAINKDTDRLYSFEISNTDIDFTQKQILKKLQEAVEGETQQTPTYEEDIIIKSNKAPSVPLEQPSEQMAPAQ